jgi:Flp pilus assembly pilin Flp
MQAHGRRLAALWSDRRGITALEYGIMASWLAFIIIGAFVKFGQSISSIFSTVGGSI